MAVCRFEKGAVLLLDGRRHQMKRMVADNLWQLESEQTGRFCEHTTSELLAMYESQRIKFDVELSDTGRATRLHLGLARQESEEDVLEVERMRRAYVLAVSEVPGTKQDMTPVIEATWQKLGKPERPPYWTTVGRWRRKFVNGKGISPPCLTTDSQEEIAIRVFQAS